MVIAPLKKRRAPPGSSQGSSQVVNSTVIDDFLIEEMDILPSRLSWTTTAAPSCSSGPLGSLGAFLGRTNTDCDDGSDLPHRASKPAAARRRRTKPSGTTTRTPPTTTSSSSTSSSSKAPAKKTTTSTTTTSSSSTLASLPFSVSSCPYLHTTPSLPAAHLQYFGNRYNYAWRSKDTYPVLVFHPGCLQPSNAVYELWRKISFESDEGAALLLLWYGEEPQCAFQVISLEEAGTKLRPYDPPPEGKEGAKKVRDIFIFVRARLRF